MNRRLFFQGLASTALLQNTGQTGTSLNVSSVGATITGVIRAKGALPPVTTLERTGRIANADWVFSEDPPVLSRWRIDPLSRGIGGVGVYVDWKLGAEQAKSQVARRRATASRRFAKLNGFELAAIASGDGRSAIPAEQIAFPNRVVRFSRGRFDVDSLGLAEGEPVIFANTDRIQYNVYCNSLSSGEVDVMLAPGDVRAFEWHAGRRFDVVCHIHSWMRLSVFVLPHDLLSLSSPEGAFAVRNVPDGRHQLYIRHLDSYFDSKGNSWSKQPVGMEVEVVNGEDVELGVLEAECSTA